VDTSRFPEFTQEVKSSMYDEAVSFFEYVLRNNRPVSDLLNARSTFSMSRLRSITASPWK
jgi:hypothetical protein